MAPSLIRVYYAHASQPNEYNTIPGFDKSNIYPWWWDPVKNILSLGNSSLLRWSSIEGAPKM